MSSIVFILGAGCSHSIGIPLMNDFLDKAFELWKLGKVDEVDKSFSLVFEARSELQRVFSKGKLDIHNLESVFSAFEMARMIGRLGKLSKEQLNNLGKSMSDVIVYTIENYSQLSKPQNEDLKIPTFYFHFVESIKKIHAYALRKQTISFITFNYDIILDYALERKFYDSIDYGIIPKERTDLIKLYKLHGSLNWVVCDECQRPAALPARKIMEEITVQNRHWHKELKGQYPIKNKQSN